MYPAEVVKHEMQCHCMAVISNLFGMSVCEPRKSAHRHTHREVLALHKRGTDMPWVRIAGYGFRFTTDAPCWAIVPFAFRHCAVNLLQHRIVNVHPERSFYGI